MPPEEYFQSLPRFPVVKLERFVQKAGLEGSLFACLTAGGATGTIKDALAWGMLAIARQSGRLEAGQMVVEAGAGHFAAALAVACSCTGHPLTLCVPFSTSSRRQQLLTELGARLKLCAAADLPALARQAEEFAQQQGACFLDHLSSDDNPEFHRRVTGPALLRGMEAEPDYVVVGVGTGGTITGVGEYCKAWSQARVVAVEPYESPVLEGGFGGRHSIPGIGLGFVPPSYNPYVVDRVLAVSSGEARQTARRLLLTEGLPACPSAGAAAAAACRLLEEAPGSRVACIFAGTEPLLEQE